MMSGGCWLMLTVGSGLDVLYTPHNTLQTVKSPLQASPIATAAAWFENPQQRVQKIVEIELTRQEAFMDSTHEK